MASHLWQVANLCAACCWESEELQFPEGPALGEEPGFGAGQTWVPLLSPQRSTCESVFLSSPSSFSLAEEWNYISLAL